MSEREQQFRLWIAALLFTLLISTNLIKVYYKFESKNVVRAKQCGNAIKRAFGKCSRLRLYEINRNGDLDWMLRCRIHLDACTRSSGSIWCTHIYWQIRWRSADTHCNCRKKENEPLLHLVIRNVTDLWFVVFLLSLSLSLSQPISASYLYCSSFNLMLVNERCWDHVSHFTFDSTFEVRFLRERSKTKTKMKMYLDKRIKCKNSEHRPYQSHKLHCIKERKKNVVVSCQVRGMGRPEKAKTKMIAIYSQLF